MADEEEDDLDELLDEVEKKFCRNVSVDMRRTHSATKPEKSLKSVCDDMDALLEELSEEDHNSSTHLKTKPSPKNVQADQKLSARDGGRKCCPVYLGGSSVTNGVGTTASKRSCDQLRCTSCDFRVQMFDDCVWDSSCDYLFLRNTMPDRLKLSDRLSQQTGSRSYCCQCSSTSTSQPIDIHSLHSLTWVCGKHPSL